MIKNSFIFLDKVSNKTEQFLWKSNIKTWQDFIDTKEIKGFSPKRKLFCDRSILQASKALKNNDSSYFIDKLPQSEMWRLYDYFKDEACYLDIETTGVGNHNYITVIGLFDGYESKTMIRDINLDIKKLKQELSNYKLFVTFNGQTFDLPFIKKRYPDLLPDIPNFDLRVACNRADLKGGLKEVEKQLDIKRNKIVEDLYGGDTLTLYKMWRYGGKEYYLKLLIEYNEEDCVNLKKIAEIVVSKLRESLLT